MVLLVSLTILVFLWMLSLSLKNEADDTAFPPVFIPNPPTLANFANVFRKNDFLQYTLYSIIVSFSATEAALLIGVPASYGIAKARAARVALLILIARITPGLSYLIPLFLLFQWLELTGTLFPIVITHLVIIVPPRDASTGPARHHGGRDPRLHFQPEQLHLWRRAGRARDTDAAGCSL